MKERGPGVAKGPESKQDPHTLTQSIVLSRHQAHPPAAASEVMPGEVVEAPSPTRTDKAEWFGEEMTGKRPPTGRPARNRVGFCRTVSKGCGEELL